jgi:DNA modification methylase
MTEEYKTQSDENDNEEELMLRDEQLDLFTIEPAENRKKTHPYPRKEGTANGMHPKNTLNELTGKEWIKFTKSWFIFNALPSDLKEEREVTEKTEDHPATFSPTMISEFIRFFTKSGQVVLDPFVGIGSTLVACDRTKRKGIGIELNPKYAKIAKMRTKQQVIIGDARKIDEMDLPKIDYCITSPPYWNILQRSTKDFRNERKEFGLDVQYSNEKTDLGNIADYEEFLNSLVDIYNKIYKILRNEAYITIIVKNVKKKGKLYPLAWDLARLLNETYVLKDEKIWMQDKVRLAPYGYPKAWVSNILHHYCLILRKEE